MDQRHPIQPLEADARGTIRFKENAIVRHIIDSHPSCDMNTIAEMEFSLDDRRQFAQLIGYSLRGYGELSYVDDDSLNAAEAMATCGLTEDKARIATLGDELVALRVGLREPMARLFGLHPDDLLEVDPSEADRP